MRLTSVVLLLLLASCAPAYQPPPWLEPYTGPKIKPHPRYVCTSYPELGLEWCDFWERSTSRVLPFMQ